MSAQVEPSVETNEWTQRVNDAQQRLRPYLPYVAAAVGLLVVVVVVMTVWGAAAAQAKQEAWREFVAAATIEDLETVLSRHPSSVVVPYAKLRIAEIMFHQSKSKLTTERGDAMLKFDEIVTLLNGLIEDSETPTDIRRQAIWTRALTRESEGALEKSREDFERIATAYAGTAMAQLAQDRAKTLEGDMARSFYGRLADFKPASAKDLPALPPPPTGAGPAGAPLSVEEFEAPPLPPIMPAAKKTQPTEKTEKTSTEEKAAKTEPPAKADAKPAEKKAEDAKPASSPPAEKAAAEKKADVPANSEAKPASK